MASREYVHVQRGSDPIVVEVKIIWVKVQNLKNPEF